MKPATADQLERRVIAPAYHDRMRDILDALWFGRINKDEAVRQLADLTDDYHEANTIIRTATAPARNCT